MSDDDELSVFDDIGQSLSESLLSGNSDDFFFIITLFAGGFECIRWWSWFIKSVITGNSVVTILFIIGVDVVIILFDVLLGGSIVVLDVDGMSLIISIGSPCDLTPANPSRTDLLNYFLSANMIQYINPQCGRYSDKTHTFHL